MSLLMEALKKAEEAKRQAGERHNDPASASAPQELAALPGQDSTNVVRGNSPLPDLSLHIDAVDAELAAATTIDSGKPPFLAERDQAERTAAHNLFAAKKPPRPSNSLWLLAGLSGIAALGLGGYFWWQLQEIPARGMTSAPVALPATSNVQPPAHDQRSTLANEAAGNPAPPPLQAAAIPDKEANPARPSQPFTPSSAQTARQSPEAKRIPRATAQPRPETADNPIRLSRTAPRTNPLLERAYDALQRGRLDDAQRDYEQVLHNDAKSTDALLGLATLAARRGQTESAHAYYLRALESDPNDATAQAGVINTRGQTNNEFSESRLKTAISAQPGATALHFALGNLYARQGRWNEAQQAYFRAYAGEPDNPDFIFNLAVSLDHLRQNKLAGQYYRMALDAGEARTPAFDRNRARTRLLELQP